MNRGEFHGRETIILANEFFQLECLAEAGPRIVRLIPSWLGENLFAEVPEAIAQTTYGDFHFLGGHRLWIAPESLDRTYIPDDRDGVTAKKIPHGIKLDGDTQRDVHIRKTITVELSPDRPFVMIKHKIENAGRSSIRMAPWALTMMRPHSTAILPQQFGAIDKDGLLPNRTFSLWSYSRWDDKRLKLDDEFITIKADSTKSPFKLGYFNPHGWLGYVFEDTFFVKRWGVRRGEDYPDQGCNAEVYTNDRFIELESLGALVDLKPREEIVHTETWEVYEAEDIPKELFGEKSLNSVLKTAE
jgi:hypothetical protein